MLDPEVQINENKPTKLCTPSRVQGPCIIPAIQWDLTLQTPLDYSDNQKTCNNARNALTNEEKHNNLEAQQVDNYKV